MDKNEGKLILRALGLGIVAGLRSMTAPAVLVAEANRERNAERVKALPNFVQAESAAKIMTVMALGEMAVDKLPFIPDRTKPGSLIFRAASGAIAGYGLFALAGKRGAATIPGALLGAAASVAASYGAMNARKAWVRSSSVPDPVVALAEDALAIGGGLLASRLTS